MQNVPIAAMPQQNAVPEKQKKSFLGAVLSSAGQVGMTAGAGMAGGAAVGTVVGAVVRPSKANILEQFVDVYARENKGKDIVKSLSDARAIRLESINLARESDGLINSFEAADNLYQAARENIKNLAAGIDKKTDVIWKEARKIAKELSRKNIIGKSIKLGAFVAMAFMVIKNFMQSSAEKKAYKEAMSQKNTVQG